jgi:DNA-binding MarR family transcriptional regulator
VSAATHELDAPPWQRVESTLMSTARTIRLAYERRLAPLELNLSQASLLAFVHETAPLTQAQLADALGLGRPATGSVIDSLERRGLVERQPDPKDRRAWRVAVTSAGERLVGPIGEVDETLRRELRAGIPRAERQRLAQVLLRLQANLSDVLAERES